MVTNFVVRILTGHKVDSVISASQLSEASVGKILRLWCLRSEAWIIWRLLHSQGCFLGCVDLKAVSSWTVD